jgi:hypothetical protein
MSSRRMGILVVVLAVVSAFLPAVVHAAGSEGKAWVTKKNRGSITGRIMVQGGGPLSGGQIIFFNVESGPPPEPERFDRTPDYVRDIREDGRFTVELPAGRYYLGATRKASGESIGPPREGDLVWRSLDKSGQPKAYAVRAGKQLDIGTMTGAAPLQPAVMKDRSVSTAIEGRVIDPDGQPVPDVVVVAFRTPNLQGKPVFISEKTDAKGRYLLRIAEGTYYLRARNEFASGPPEPGQIVGFYGEGAAAPVTIKAGEVLKGIDFTVIRFPGRGPYSGGR